MTIHPDTQTQRHDKPTEPGSDHDIAPAVHTDARDNPPVTVDVDVDVEVDREEIVPLGRRSPQPRPQTPPRYARQPQILAGTVAAFVGLTITINVLLAHFDAGTPRHDRGASPTISVNGPDTVAQPHQAAATPRLERHQRMLAAQRDAQQHQRARRAARQRARDLRVAERNRRALSQRRRLATRSARARAAAASRRAHAISRRRSTPTPARSHTTPPPPARQVCGDFDLC
jgi:hypothetical protein